MDQGCLYTFFACYHTLLLEALGASQLFVVFGYCLLWQCYSFMDGKRPAGKHDGRRRITAGDILEYRIIHTFANRKKAYRPHGLYVEQGKTFIPPATFPFSRGAPGNSGPDAS